MLVFAAKENSPTLLKVACLGRIDLISETTLFYVTFSAELGKYCWLSEPTGMNTSFVSGPALNALHTHTWVDASKRQ